MISAWRILSVVVGIFSTISLPGHAALVDIEKSGHVAYFTFASPDKIVRYDMSRAAFLPEIALSGAPRAIAIEQQRLVVGYHDNADTIDLDTLESSFLTQTSSELREIQIVDGVAYFNLGEAGLLSFGLDPLTAANGSHISTSGTALIGSRRQSAIFMRPDASDLSRIGKFRVTKAGTVISSLESHYQDALPAAHSLFLFPDQDRLLDSAGIVYYAMT